MKKFFSVFFLSAFTFIAPVCAADVFVVRQVTDGDTLVLHDGERVRLIGVDTPEMHDDKRNRQHASRNHINERIVKEFAGKAKKFVSGAVEGRSVRLEYDWQRKDKYGRTLAYVYRQPDDYFLNAEIIREGYGFAYLVFPFKYLEEFRHDAGQAQKKKLGLWKS
jgi:micrococcal nuclease